MVDRCFDRPGTDRIHPDAALQQFGRQGAREGAHGRLRGGQQRPAGGADLVQPGGVENDRTTGAHDRLHGLQREEQSLHVDIHQAVVLGFSGAGQRCAIGHAGVGEEDIQAAERLLHGVGHVLQIVPGAHIGDQLQHVGAERLARLFEFRDVAPADGDTRSVVAQQFCRG
ncbi:hypothetical protein D3C78_1438290 [compost metagenome]